MTKIRTRRSKASNSRAPGFTLLELLVAVAILAIALLSAFKAMGQANIALYEGRSRVVALWVAQNQIAGLRIRKMFPTPNSVDQGQEEQAGNQYHWQHVFKPTPNNNILRVETSVSLPAQPDLELAHVTSFIRRRN